MEIICDRNNGSMYFWIGFLELREGFERGRLVDRVGAYMPPSGFLLSRNLVWRHHVEYVMETRAVVLMVLLR